MLERASGVAWSSNRGLSLGISVYAAVHALRRVDLGHCQSGGTVIDIVI